MSNSIYFECNRNLTNIYMEGTENRANRNIEVGNNTKSFHHDISGNNSMTKLLEKRKEERYNARILVRVTLVHGNALAPDQKES